MKIVHKLIAKTAKAIACEVYEKWAGESDRFYRANPSLDRWVARHWKDYIQNTRQIFAMMLASPACPQDQKDEIYEAMLMDSAYKAPAPLDQRKLKIAAGIDPDEPVRKSKLFNGTALH